MRRHAVTDHPAAEPADRHEERVGRVGQGRPRGQDQVHLPGPAHERANNRERVVRVVPDVGHAGERRTERFDPQRDPAFEPLPVLGPERLPDHGGDPPRNEGHHAHQRRATPGQREAALQHGSGNRVRAHLHARHELAGLDGLAVVQAEHQERVDPVEPLDRGRPNPKDTVGGREQIDPAAGRAAQLDAGSRDRAGEPERRVILVDVVGVEDQERDGLGRAIVGGPDGPRPPRRRRQVARRRPASAGAPSTSAPHRSPGRARARRRWPPGGPPGPG